MFYVISLLLASAAAASSSGLTVANKLDDQLPPIARVGQDYRWTFSANTFANCDTIENHTTSPLPAWLHFDTSSRTFQGKPSEKDIGVPDITVTAHGCNSSKSDWFNIFTTARPAPTLQIPIAKQFNQSNPSLSSVFTISPNSAIKSGVPTLRVPAGWSFSIGFDGDTLTGGNIHYQTLQDDGSALPEWMTFNKQTITLNGVATHAEPRTVHCMLHGSDEVGYTAEKHPFDIVVASHELVVSSAMPTINVTAGDSFSLSLSSAADFWGVYIDDVPIQPKNISTLAIDTSPYDWLTYDPLNWTLTGKPTNSDLERKPFLLVSITTLFNQSIQTNVTIDHVPSYFSSDTLPALYASDQDIRYDLSAFVSSSSKRDVNVSATFQPSEMSDYLSFDQATSILSGHLPGSVPQSYINVTFTAYSHLTHSTSHASLPIILPSTITNKAGHTEGGDGLSGMAHKRLAIGLGVTFGVLGGFCLLVGLLAACRRYARVEDTAIGGEEGMKGWSEKDRKWYGLDANTNEKVDYGLSGPGGIASPASAASSAFPTSPPRTRVYPNLGPGSGPQSPGMMTKHDFMAKVKDTVRNVSDKYRSRRAPDLGNRRPVIGKPILIKSSPFDDIHGVSRSSASSASRSPTMVHFADKLSRQNSTDSIGSNASVRTHAAEAVVQTAHKTTVRSASLISTPEIPRDANGRPRVKQFKGANRVPIPQTSIASPSEASSDGGHGFPGRVPSQKARIELYDDESSLEGHGGNQTTDDLAMGMRYVQALGASDTVNPVPSQMTMSTNARSSYSSFGSTPDNDVNVVRTGEQFKLRVHLRPPTSAVSYSMRSEHLTARLTSGLPLPPFVHADLDPAKQRGWIELHGIPSVTDAGEMEIGVYTFAEGVCLARVALTVTRRR